MYTVSSSPSTGAGSAGETRGPESGARSRGERRHTTGQPAGDHPPSRDDRRGGLVGGRSLLIRRLVSQPLRSRSLTQHGKTKNTMSSTVVLSERPLAARIAMDRRAVHALKSVGAPAEGGSSTTISNLSCSRPGRVLTRGCSFVRFASPCRGSRPTRICAPTHAQLAREVGRDGPMVITASAVTPASDSGDRGVRATRAQPGRAECPFRSPACARDALRRSPG